MEMDDNPPLARGENEDRWSTEDDNMDRERDEERGEHPNDKQMLVSNESRDAKRQGAKGGGCFGCLARVPCASLIAWIMLMVGLGGFAAASYIGIVRTRDLLDATWFMEFTEIVLVIISAVTFPLGTLFLVVAWLSSGSTPKLLLNSSKKNIAARTFNVLVLILAYFLHIAWVLLLAIVLIPFYVMVLIWYLKDSRNIDCIDLNNYGVGFKGDKDNVTYGPVEYCRTGENNDLEAFWARMFDSWVCWVAAAGGAFLVILSLVHFMVAIGGNLKHLKEQRPSRYSDDMNQDNDSMQRYETKL